MKPVVLSGFMATGKSTVGPALAARLGVPFVDTDALIEGESGRRVPDLWRAEGEALFRARESALVTRLLADPTPRVIAFGGGTVTTRATRHLALDRAFVVTLTADPATIVSRVKDVNARPNLAVENPLGRVVELLEARRGAYAEAHLSLSTDSVDVESLVDAIVAAAARDPLVMPLGERTYTIEIGNDAPTLLTDSLAALSPSTLIVVSDSNVQRCRGAALDSALAHLAIQEGARVILAPGEEFKTLASVATIWDAALGAGVDRDAVVVAFGGGVVGDLAGFAASALLRGLRFAQVPTTLLSMVDSSVGGKTGFDHVAGKNLLGAFHQPSTVVVDIAHLSTLPPRDRTAGLAEIVKIALACDASLLDLVEAHATDLATGAPGPVEAVVRAAISAKIRVVRDDERELGARALLNLGHTIGHALEAHGGYSKYRHGEAVAVGMMCELEATEAMGHTPRALVERTRSLLERLGLPASVSPAEVASAWPFVSTDKKRVGDRVKLPIVTAAGSAHVERVRIADLRARALR